jgi:hypothetical protein
MKAEKEAARNALLEMLKPNTTIYSIVRSVANSGMSRTIDFYAIQDNRPVYLSGYISDLLDLPRSKASGALRITGAGMDMCFATVYETSRKLFNDGYSLKSEVI